MACPTIKYGVPDTGATELSINSGRELFRCGTACVKMFITNVSLEKNTVFFLCGTVADAGFDDFCLQNFNINWRDRTVVNFIAKENVDSSLENGTVITRVGECQGDDGVVYTHTEGQISFRALANLEDITIQLSDDILQAVIGKYLTVVSPSTYSQVTTDDLEAILSDLSNNVGVTEFQGMSGTYLLFGVRTPEPTEEQSYRFSFNYNNGRGEERQGRIIYDGDNTPQPLATIISTLISQ